jgi:hypothetical protein
MDLKNCEVVLRSSGSRYSPLTAFCAHRNEPSFSVTVQELTD